MKVLLTGAFGNVGLSTLDELIKKDYQVKVFEVKNSRNQRISQGYKKKAEIFWGDIRNIEDVKKAVYGSDVVIHTAAIIPPLADQKPKLAESVNFYGTANIISAMKNEKKPGKLIYTSSIAVYGDRLKNPMIYSEDSPNPNSHDEYARQKLECEKMIRESGLEYTIFRLTYIVSMNKLKMDPLMFDMPLETSIEICDTKDVGLALSNAVENNEILGKTLNIAGGEKCRTSYREYLDRMTELFGLGKGFLPKDAFGKDSFHCGYMETAESEKFLKYQRHTLADYFNEVKKKVAASRFFMRMFKPTIRQYLLKRSKYYCAKPARA
ncbi:MAG: NAD(P)-dependent oxidoreductase [Candidatus Woesearchaeota archaeon]|nr:NAD(P)-dependent oxidoreductase [Candidatus Woesearchaeota archaeon]